MSNDIITNQNTTYQKTTSAGSNHTIYPQIWRRFASIVYDSLVLLAVSMGYGGLAMGIDQLILGENDAFVSGVLFQIGWGGVIAGFFCYFWMKAGQTIGMRAWRLQVININTGQHPSLPYSMIRCLCAPMGLLLFFSAYTRKDRRCLHDCLSKTQLILLPPLKKQGK